MKHQLKCSLYIRALCSQHLQSLIMRTGYALLLEWKQPELTFMLGCAELRQTEVQAGAAVVMASGGGPSMGALLQGLGRRLAGKKVMRHWPDNGGWWEADIDTYNASTGQHRCQPCFASPGHTDRLAHVASSSQSSCIPTCNTYVHIIIKVQGWWCCCDQRAALAVLVDLCLWTPGVPLWTKPCSVCASRASMYPGS